MNRIQEFVAIVSSQQDNLVVLWHCNRGKAAARRGHGRKGGPLSVLVDFRRVQGSVVFVASPKDVNGILIITALYRDGYTSTARCRQRRQHSHRVQQNIVQLDSVQIVGILIQSTANQNRSVRVICATKRNPFLFHSNSSC